MADLNKGFKGVFLKGMEAISSTASRIATTTKYKVDEMNIVNRRREILTDFGAKSYELWQKGEQFPTELDALLQELHQLELELGAIRAAKNTKVEEEPVESKADTFEDKVEDVLDKVEDSLEAMGDRIEDAFDSLKDAEKDDEATKDVPVIQVEELERVAADEDKPCEAAPSIKTEE